jgi:excisionase family DNA binding protein
VPAKHLLPIPGETPCVNAFSGLTVRDVARRYRVGEDKVRRWIAHGELKAVNTAAALCGRPRWVIMAESLEEFEQRRTGSAPPKTQRTRTRRLPVDFYP